MASSAPESLVQYEAAIDKDGAPAKEAGGKKKISSSQVDEILNSILPPREFTVEGRQYLQYTSKAQATRTDVVQLQENLDRKLEERYVSLGVRFFVALARFSLQCHDYHFGLSRLSSRQARESGICPVREDLYSQGFDELIRQITLNCSERGLLLLRVRDEIRMTIDAYKTLYDSSVTFGVRKQLQAEQGVAEMEEKIKSLEENKVALEVRRLTAVDHTQIAEEGYREEHAPSQRHEDINEATHPLLVLVASRIV